jgi:hypothetical protein
MSTCSLPICEQIWPLGASTCVCIWHVSCGLLEWTRTTSIGVAHPCELAEVFDVMWAFVFYVIDSIILARCAAFVHTSDGAKVTRTGPVAPCWSTRICYLTTTSSRTPSPTGNSGTASQTSRTSALSNTRSLPSAYNLAESKIKEKAIGKEAVFWVSSSRQR